MKKGELKTVRLKWKDIEMNLIIRHGSLSDKGGIEEIFIRNSYHTMLKNIKGKIVVDAGAYIGDSTVILAKLGAKKIYAYEPHPELHKLLIANLKENKVGNCIAINAGLSNTAARATIVGRANTSFGSGNGIFIDKEKDIVKIKIVSANKEFKKIIAEDGKIDLCKLDIEGFELNVVLSLEKSVMDNIERFIIECHSKIIKEEVTKCLNMNGFTIKQEIQSARNKRLFLMEAVKI